MILCIETATAVCSVALTENGNVVSQREVNEGYSHAEKLTVFISEVVSEAGKKLTDLKAVAVSSGPGSYTGLRIGVSVAKGLCYALDIPLISISTLEAMAAGAINSINGENALELFCPMIDARRMEVYCALFDSQLNTLQQPSAEIVTENFLSNHSSTKKIVYFGDGAEKCNALLKNNFELLPSFFPSAKFMAGLAYKKFSNELFENMALFEPFYLKEYKPGIAKVNEG